jgi:hypothetical protein
MSDAFRPIRTLTRILVGLLAVGGALGALGALLGAVQGIAFPELAGLEAPETDGHTVMLIGVGCQALTYLFVYLVTVIVFGMFLHRSNRNARALGAQGMEYTPGWTVGWYFVPFLNLVKPYHAVQEIYRATDPDADAYDWTRAYVPGLLPWWWGLWIVSNVLGALVGRLAMSSDATAHAIAPWVDVLDGLLDVALAAVAIVLVRRLADRQEHKARVASFA